MSPHGSFDLHVEIFSERLELFKKFDMDYFTIDKTGEKNYRDIYYAFQSWGSRDQWVNFFTATLKKPHLMELRKNMLPKVRFAGCWFLLYEGL